MPINPPPINSFLGTRERTQDMLSRTDALTLYCHWQFNKEIYSRQYYNIQYVNSLILIFKTNNLCNWQSKCSWFIITDLALAPIIWPWQPSCLLSSLFQSDLRTNNDNKASTWKLLKKQHPGCGRQWRASLVGCQAGTCLWRSVCKDKLLTVALMLNDKKSARMSGGTCHHRRRRAFTSRPLARNSYGPTWQPHHLLLHLHIQERQTLLRLSWKLGRNLASDCQPSGFCWIWPTTSRNPSGVCQLACLRAPCPLYYDSCTAGLLLLVCPLVGIKFVGFIDREGIGHVVCG